MKKTGIFNRLMTTETNLMGFTQSQNKTTIGRAKKKAGNGSTKSIEDSNYVFNQKQQP